MSTAPRCCRCSYNAVDGRRLNSTTYTEVADAIGLDHDDAEAAAEYIVDSGFAEWAGFGGYLEITQRGILAIEQAMRETAQATVTVRSRWSRHPEAFQDPRD